MKIRRAADRRVQYYADMLKALGSETRLRILRLLVQHGDHGCCVTDIQKEVGGANSTLSHHLETLARFGLVDARKEAQWIFYSVNFLTLREVLNFLMEDCCSRSPQLLSIATGPAQGGGAPA